MIFYDLVVSKMHCYDKIMIIDFFLIKKIKYFLDQGKSFIISVNQDVIDWRNKEKEGIIQKW